MTGFDFYHDEIPEHLALMSQTKAMLRLRQVGMNCGCEYTRFPRFVGCDAYSRYEHSLGVGLIVWHFTGSIAQSMAGLLHDISTPVFAHVIDFLRGDHLKQESTENGTCDRIADSEDIQQILRRYALSTHDVCDYHVYPIADNDTPKLSADRLEYTLGNAVNYRFADMDTVKRLYAALRVGKNEYGEEELLFPNQQDACEFGKLAMCCSEVYIADEDRFSMQALEELLRSALTDGVISVSDLDLTESEVLSRLCTNKVYADRWKLFCSYSRMERSNEPAEGWLKIPAKKRYIDPYIEGRGRLSTLNREYRDRIEEFNGRSLDYYVMGYPS